MKRIISRIALWLLIIIAALGAVYVAFSLIVRPSSDRDWNLDQAVQPEISQGGDVVTIKNVRDFIYRSTSDYDARYYDRAYDLSKLTGAYFMVEPFSGNSGAAHTLLSFEFASTTGEPERVAISVEIRKEKGESFSAVKGLLRQYELMYVIADEADVIKLRTNYRKDKVFLYPVTASPEKLRALFISMIGRAAKLQQEPEFYNTLTSTCTTNIVSHINEIADADKQVPFDVRVLLPANSDALAQELGFIDSSMPLEELRANYFITDKAQACAEGEDFSACIRK